jgi:hypothetical protein
LGELGDFQKTPKDFGFAQGTSQALPQNLRIGERVNGVDLFNCLYVHTKPPSTPTCQTCGCIIEERASISRAASGQIAGIKNFFGALAPSD